jgi:hypothetical protein
MVPYQIENILFKLNCFVYIFNQEHGIIENSKYSDGSSYNGIKEISNIVIELQAVGIKYSIDENQNIVLE